VLETKKIVLKDNTVINVFANDYIGNIIEANNDYYEKIELDKFLEYIPKNGIIYDIGANIGNHTLFFSRYTLPQKIFAFEPIKEVCEVLVHNLRKNNINNSTFA
jgi:hypothetical protein